MILSGILEQQFPEDLSLSDVYDHFYSDRKDDKRGEATVYSLKKTRKCRLV